MLSLSFSPQTFGFYKKVKFGKKILESRSVEGCQFKLDWCSARHSDLVTKLLFAGE